MWRIETSAGLEPRDCPFHYLLAGQRTLIDLASLLLGIALALLLLFKFEEKSKRWALAIFALIAALQGVGYWEKRVAGRETDALRTFGELQPLTKGVERADGTWLELEIGCNGASFLFLVPRGQTTYPLFAVIPRLAASGLRVSNTERGARVSALVRALDGNVVAELVENEWKLNPGQFFQRNFDDSGLEVIDNSGRVLLQIEMLGDRVRLQGVFVDRNGMGLALVGLPGQGSVLQKLPRAVEDKLHPIRRLFRYPAEAHPGERDPGTECPAAAQR